MAKDNTVNIGGLSGLNNLEGFSDIRMNREIGNGKVVSILWYHKHRCLIITQHKRYYRVLKYASDTKKTRKFKGKTYADNLRELKKFSTSEYDLKGILSILVNRIQFK